ncbi:hypothetical protein A5782_06645 [Mycobacterium sp. 852002-40037_SCH5390672]|nr:hypothetical protein A5782_06645 [Mycobacterium sp. 852002-40037_SCH5390672]
MREPFIGSEALAAGTVTRHRLRSRFVALHPDVYVAPGTELGWIVVRVTAEDVPGGILRRVAAAWSRRG